MSPKHFRVFMASPGDVKDERELALEVLDQIQYDPSLRGRLTIEAVAWDKKGAGAPILANLTPQDSIKNGLPRPSECDIVVVIFWSRMGTPLPKTYAKADGTRYHSGTEWEYFEAVEGALINKRPSVLLYRCAKKVLLDQDDPDFENKRAQYVLVKDFFKSFINTDGSFSAGYTDYQTPSDFKDKLAYDLKYLFEAALKTHDMGTAPSPAAVPDKWPASPFPGLRAFTMADAPIFFGREAEIDSLVEIIHRNAFTAVVGASGSGKSSLVGAGVIPRLVLGSDEWKIISTTPDSLGSNNPFSALSASLLRDCEGLDRIALAKRLENDESHLKVILSNYLDKSPSYGRILLFIDQFEELVTTVNPRYRESFVRTLSQLTLDKRLRIVITLRGDFYGRLIGYQDLADLIESTTFPLSAPRLTALRNMITKPAARADLQFSDGLAERILEDTGVEPGSLALMAYTLDELYRLCSDGRALTMEAYESLGGVQGAIGTRSEVVFRSLSTSQQMTLPAVFRELVEVDEKGIATRQRATFARVATTPAARKLVNALTDARLLVQYRGPNNESFVEIGHEALLKSWERLADWISETQDDLRLLRQVRIASTEWDANGRREDFLWSHERLEPVNAMQNRLELEFDEPLKSFTRPEVERLLHELSAKPKYTNQKLLIERLEKIGVAALPALIEALKLARTKSARGDIYRILERYKEFVIKDLEKALYTGDARLRYRSLEALGRFGISSQAELIRPFLDDPDLNVQFYAMAALGFLGRPADIKNIALKVSSADIRVGIFALAVLAGFPNPDIDVFLFALESKLEEIRSAAVYLIGVLGNKNPDTWYYTRYSILSHLGLSYYEFGKEHEDLYERLSSAVFKNQGELSTLVSKVGVIKSISKLHSDGSSEVRIKLAQTLGRLGDPIGLQTLEILLGDVLEEVQLAAVKALPSIVTGKTPTILAKCMKNRHPNVRREAAMGLGKLFDRKQNENLPAEEALWVARALIKRFKFDDIESCRGLAFAFGKMAYKPASRILRKSMTNKDVELRKLAAVALGEIGDKSALPELLAALEDPDLDVKAAAADSIGSVGNDEAANVLLSYLGGRHHRLENKEIVFKRSLISSIGRLRYKPAIFTLESIYEKTDSWAIQMEVRKSLRAISS